MSKVDMRNSRQRVYPRQMSVRLTKRDDQMLNEMMKREMYVSRADAMRDALRRLHRDLIENGHTE